MEDGRFRDRSMSLRYSVIRIQESANLSLVKPDPGLWNPEFSG